MPGVRPPPPQSYPGWVISFLSDLNHPLSVGVAHGVIERIAPGTLVVDLDHSIPPDDLRAGALALTRAIQYLPDGVILAALGDRGRPIAAATPAGFVVGRDNGSLSPAVAMIGGAEMIVHIENPEMRIPSPGAVDLVRDVLAPAAALLASGQARLDQLGAPLPAGTVTPLLLPLPEVGDTTAVGEVWWANRHEHAQTNLGPEDLELLGLRVGSVATIKVGPTIHPVTWREAGEDHQDRIFLYVDEYGLVTVACADGPVDEEIGLRVGTAITVAVPPPPATR